MCRSLKLRPTQKYFNEFSNSLHLLLKLIDCANLKKIESLLTIVPCLLRKNRCGLRYENYGHLPSAQSTLVRDPGCPFACIHRMGEL